MQRLALTALTSGGRSVRLVRLQTTATVLQFFLDSFQILRPKNQIAARDAYIFGLRNQRVLSKARNHKLLNPSMKSLCPKPIKQRIFTV
jgi:hypothetical protein